MTGGKEQENRVQSREGAILPSIYIAVEKTAGGPGTLLKLGLQPASRCRRIHLTPRQTVASLPSHSSQGVPFLYTPS